MSKKKQINFCFHSSYFSYRQNQRNVIFPLGNRHFITDMGTDNFRVK